MEDKTETYAKTVLSDICNNNNRMLEQLQITTMLEAIDPKLYTLLRAIFGDITSIFHSADKNRNGIVKMPEKFTEGLLTPTTLPMYLTIAREYIVSERGKGVTLEEIESYLKTTSESELWL